MRNTFTHGSSGMQQRRWSLSPQPDASFSGATTRGIPAYEQARLPRPDAQSYIMRVHSQLDGRGRLAMIDLRSELCDGTTCSIYDDEFAGPVLTDHSHLNPAWVARNGEAFRAFVRCPVTRPPRVIAAGGCRRPSEKHPVHRTISAPTALSCFRRTSCMRLACSIVWMHKSAPTCLQREEAMGMQARRVGRTRMALLVALVASLPVAFAMPTHWGWENSWIENAQVFMLVGGFAACVASMRRASGRSDRVLWLGIAPIWLLIAAGVQLGRGVRRPDRIHGRRPAVLIQHSLVQALRVRHRRGCPRGMCPVACCRSARPGHRPHAPRRHVSAGRRRWWFCWPPWPPRLRKAAWVLTPTSWAPRPR